MLVLKRNQRFNQLYKCDVTGENIYPGMLYYQDDKDGTIVSFKAYREMLEQKKLDNWDYSRINRAEDERDYRESLKLYTQQYLHDTLLERQTPEYGEKRHRDTDAIKEVYDYMNNRPKGWGER